MIDYIQKLISEKCSKLFTKIWSADWSHSHSQLRDIGPFNIVFAF